MHHQTLRHCKVERDHFEISQGCHCGDRNLNKPNSTACEYLSMRSKSRRFPPHSIIVENTRLVTLTSKPCSVSCHLVSDPAESRGARQVRSAMANSVLLTGISFWGICMNGSPYLILLEVSGLCISASCTWSLTCLELDISILLFNWGSDARLFNTISTRSQTERAVKINLESPMRQNTSLQIAATTAKVFAHVNLECSITWHCKILAPPCADADE